MTKKWPSNEQGKWSKNDKTWPNPIILGFPMVSQSPGSTKITHNHIVLMQIGPPNRSVGLTMTNKICTGWWFGTIYWELDYPSHKMCIPFMASHSDIKYIDYPKSQHFLDCFLCIPFTCHEDTHYCCVFPCYYSGIWCFFVFPWSTPKTNTDQDQSSAYSPTESPSYLSHSYPHYSWFYMVLAFYPPYAPLRGFFHI